MTRVTVFKASAGSGKTFTLAVQYIKLLITNNPQEYRHTLAVTFTNKATAEMKDRILEQLYGIGQGLDTSKAYLEALKREMKGDGLEMNDNEIRRRCREAMSYILHDYSRFRIETIDSFFQSVLRNLAHELGLSARMQVDINDKQILAQAVDNMVDGLGEANAVQPWIDEYVKEQIANAESWDVRGNIKALASIIFKEEYLHRSDAQREAINDEATVREYKSILQKIKAQAKVQMDDTIYELCAAIDPVAEQIATEFASGTWILNYAMALQDEKYKEASQVTEKRRAAMEEDPRQLLKGKKNKEDPELLELAQRLSDIILNVENARHAYLAVANSVDLTLRHISPMRLLDEIERQVTEITTDSNRFILAKTPILLSKLIQGNDAPFVFEKMGTLFNNVMIDEFQDTSSMQWNNFRVLLLESQSKGGNDLLVGDIKQSIYRWRNGDWRILKNIGSELGYIKPEIKTLDTNFRSKRNVIDFNNRFFVEAARVLGQREQNSIIEDIYEDVEQRWPESRKPEGFVRMQICSRKNSEWEENMYTDLCEQIRSLHQGGLPYNKMCVLIRNHSQAPKLIDFVRHYLADDNVQMVSSEAFLLSSSKAIQIIISALRMLCNTKADPVNERYVIKLYKQYVLGCSLSLADCFADDIEMVLPEAFIQHQKELAEYPLSELCEELYRILHLERVEGEDAYTLAFFDGLSEFLQNSASDIHAFLEYWDSELSHRAIPACEVDGISIVTIHKSKGLQYHTVFMPLSPDDMKAIKYSQLLWCEGQQDPYNTFGRLPINGSKETFLESTFSDDYKEEQLQRCIEELNALYVAFTRAECNLYAWGKTGEKSYNFANLINDVMRTTSLQEIASASSEDTIETWCVGAPITTIKEKGDEKPNRMNPTYSTEKIAMSSHNRRFDFRQSNEAERFISTLNDGYEAEQNLTADGLTFIEQGKLLHEIFSSIEVHSQIDTALQTYVDKGIITNEKQKSRIRNLIERSLKNDKVQTWFDGTYTVKNECEIIEMDKATGCMVTHRPDRVMMSDTSIVVVDFKFGRPHPEEYVPQVQRYMRLLQEMHPDKCITGYLWYVYKNQIEQVEQA